MYTVEESWRMSEVEKVVAIIKEVGVWRLGNFDGCCCCKFGLRNVDISVSCGKGGSRGVTVSSDSLDYYETASGVGPDVLRPIAEEAARQVENSDGRGPCPVHIES